MKSNNYDDLFYGDQNWSESKDITYHMTFNSNSTPIGNDGCIKLEVLTGAEADYSNNSNEVEDSNSNILDDYDVIIDHYTESSPIKIEPCNEAVNTATEDTTPKKKSRRKPANNQKLNCTFCSKVFAKKQQLENHIKTHTKEKNFKCETCGKSFIHKQQLMNHEKIHSGTKDFQCDICKKSFMLKQQLHVHIKTHTGEKNFACTLCEKSFITKQQLQNHTNSHLGVKPFTCTECWKKFAHKQQLERHKQNHMLKQNHNCTQCHAKFLSKTTLNVHVKEMHMS